MDFNASLRKAIKTGDVMLGQNSTAECIKDGKAQIVVVAANCPAPYKTMLDEQNDVYVHTFEGSSMQLGKACGKPFMVSVLAIISAGESDIISLKRA